MGHYGVGKLPERFGSWMFVSVLASTWMETSPVTDFRRDQGGGQQPFLWIEKQLPWPKKDLERLTLQQFEDMWANGDRLMKTIATDSVRVQIARPEIDHLDFGDAGMLNAALDERALRGKERTLIITRQAVLTFFNRHLKAPDSRYDLERLQADFAEVKIVRFRGRRFSRLQLERRGSIGAGLAIKSV